MSVIFITGFLVFICMFPSLCVSGALDGIDTALNIVVPSLFPFFVVSKMFILSGGASFFGRYLNNIMKVLFNVSGNGASSFVIGIVSGYPVGAMTVCETYERGEISKDEAQNLIGFCNNSGPSFLIGAVGCAMLGSREIGFALYLIHVLSAITVGIISRWQIKGVAQKTFQGEYKKEKDIFTTAVEESVFSILGVCGYIVFFAVVINIISKVSENVFLTGFFEMTTAVKNLCKSDVLLDYKFVIISFLCGWSGLSVNMQVKRILKKTDLSFKKYAVSKLMQSVLAGMYSIVYITLFPTAIKTANIQPKMHIYSQNTNMFLIMTILIFLVYTTKWGRTRFGTILKKCTHRRGNS